MTFFSIEVEGGRVRVEADGMSMSQIARLVEAYEASGPVRQESMTAPCTGDVRPSADPQPTAAAPAPTTTYACDQCDKAGMSKQGLAVHTSRKHKPADAAVARIDPHRCEECRMSFRNFDALRQHSLTKHDRLPKQGPA